MTYNVIAYKHTGLNGVNIMDSPAKLQEVLDSADKVELPAVDLLWNKQLNNVRVNATEEQIDGIDYVQIGDCYYSAGTPTPDNADTWTIPLAIDGVSTAGGIAALTFTDGITERHTTKDDILFKYTQSDELTAPAEPLQLVTGGMQFGKDKDDHAGYYIIVESTVDLVALGNQFDENGNLIKGKGMVFHTEPQNEDGTYPENDKIVVVPSTEGVQTRTDFVLNDVEAPSPNSQLYVLYTVEYYQDGSGEWQHITTPHLNIVRALNALRALNAESSIISQTYYSGRDVMVDSDGKTGIVNSIKARDVKRPLPDNMKFSQYADIHNNRVAYGEYNLYGILTASGEKAEFRPEQIATAEDAVPTIRKISDPRPTGKPFFRFENYMNDKTDTGFWMLSVSGMQWQNVPLTFSEAGGSYLNIQNFKSSQVSASEAMQWNNTQYQMRQIGTTARGVAGITTAAMTAANPFSWLSGDGAQAVGSGIQTAIDTAYQLSMQEAQNQYDNNQYIREREKETRNFAVSQTVVVPEVMFPFNADVIRDFVGNGVFCYRYKYSDNDAKRIDKLLTMYGYRDTQPLTTELFFNRKHFDYVRASGVAIGGDNIPMWLKAVIANQLNAGIRVWHEKPDTNVYNTGNPVSED